MKGNEERKKNRIHLTAEELNRFIFRKRLFTILAIAGTILLATIYAISAVYMITGSFTVNVNKYEMVKYGLSLSEHKDLSHPSSVLNAKIDQSITNIAEEDLPDDVDNIDGTHNGRNHIAYTFYLYNAGTIDEMSYEWQILMSNVFQGIDAAVRVRLYIDGVPTTYAKTATDGSGPEPGTVEFYSTDTIAQGRVDNFSVGSVTKFTIVIWLEGNDPDCIDWIKGGKMKIDMRMSVIH